MSGAALVGGPILANAPGEGGIQANTAITGLAGGGFAEAWSFNGNVFVRVFDDTGIPITTEISVAPTGNFNDNPQLASNGSGFVLTFSGSLPVTGERAIFSET